LVIVVDSISFQLPITQLPISGERVSIQLAKVNTGQNKNSEGNVLEVDDKAVENASLEALGNGPGFGELQPPFERIGQLLLEPE